ncbi:MAG: carboxypeptidase regulatory-like domain-containing protein, partial [Alistipes sp.]|nr:carboxypeptidase regulatory-like domain-containing protein [Alistipes sp.]
MKKMLFTMIAAWASLTAWAQTPVSGRITDMNQQPVGYATVALLRGTTPIAAAASDLEGAFQLTVRERGEYTLSVTSVGYSSHTAP